MVGWRKGATLLALFLSGSLAFAVALAVSRRWGLSSLDALSCTVYWGRIAANLVGLLSLALLVMRCHRRDGGDLRWQPSPAIVAVFFCAWGLLLFVPTRGGRGCCASPDGDQPRIVFWDTAKDALPTPDVEADTTPHGARLFAETRTLLARAGFVVESRHRLAGGCLDGASVLCILMPGRAPDRAESRAIQAFIRAGGRVLVAAEHTDMEGVKEACDGLLAAYGITINFDTATSLMGNLAAGTRSSGGALGNLFRKYGTLAYNRGASLHLSGYHAAPLLTGDAWHADVGDRSGASRAFLGDEKWSAGDRVGNVVLVASHGGWMPSLVVFGDTSPFINRNVPYNAPFLLDLFRLLSAGPEPDRILVVAGFGLAFALALLLVWPRIPLAACKGRGVPLWVAYGSVALASVVLLRADSPPAIPAGPPPAAPRLVISTEEQNLFSRDPFADESVVPLARIAGKAGFLCSVGPWRQTSGIDRLLVINPARTAWMEDILDHLGEGGTVIVSGGGDNPHFVRLLARFGCVPCGLPLGRLRGEEFDTVSAWRISHADNAKYQDLRADDTVVGTCIEVEGRRVVLLADSGFFRAKEMTAGTEDGKNAQFVERLLDE
jgi:hypothetical protein